MKFIKFRVCCYSVSALLILKEKHSSRLTTAKKYEKILQKTNFFSFKENCGAFDQNTEAKQVFCFGEIIKNALKIRAVRGVYTLLISSY